MTMVYVGALNTPNFICLSTDIVGGALPGAARPGNTIFAYNTAEWWIIEPDLTLSTFTLPVEINVDPGSINIGIVDQGAPTAGTPWPISVPDGTKITDIDQPLDAARNLTPYYNEQDVASSGTAEPLLPSATYASMILVWAKSLNVGSICFGTSAVDKTSSRQIVLSPGSMASIDVPLGYRVGVHQFYVDADNNNDGVQFFYMK